MTAFPLERGVGDTTESFTAVPRSENLIIDSRVYPLDLTHNGWKVKIESLSNGHTGMSSYLLSRAIDEGLDLETLGKKIGITDENGNNANGYSIMETMDEKNARILNFTFNGIPTAKTADVVMRLVKEFLPPYLKMQNLKLVASSNTVGGYKIPIAERIILTNTIR